MDGLDEKYAALVSGLRKHGAIAAAFSGGVDSALLLRAAKDALGGNVLAVIARSPLLPESEFSCAVQFCESEGVRLKIYEHDALNLPGFRENPENRCYICKKALLSGIIEAAKSEGIAAVAEGSNLDDENDFRPGARAVAELGVLSPLREAGLTKAEIRELSRRLGLPTAEKPPLACLASRIPYGEAITAGKLLRVEKAEDFLRGLGVTQVRVRSCGDTARIEILPEEFPLVTGNDRRAVTERLTALGFRYVSLDLEGYRTGSLNKKPKT